MTHSPPIRLSKVMADLGICSRREADVCIENGWVTVNGEVVSTLGTKIDPESRIMVSQEGQQWLRGKMTIMINKPVGFVSGQAEDGYEPASNLLNEHQQIRFPGDPAAPTRKDLFTMAPAGRLDIDSWGLLILTQDGRIAKKLIGADTPFDKEYHVWVDGEITREKITRLTYGMSLDGKRLKPAIIEHVKDNQIKFILREGKKRQIRRMCELVDLEVTGLVRTRIGPLVLGNLKLGEWRYLSRKEVFDLLGEE
ncbi:MAG: rRNA pseudouridine synthase [Bdellovibrionaceae bacterium]|nr:rRNA pseudouridine synthase [Pseudobdellovibrionaceae bacterium]